MLNWIQQFDTFCFLDNHHYSVQPHAVECLAAAGVRRSISEQAGTALGQLQGFIEDKASWLFGHLGYDLKNEMEDLHSANPDGIGFPDLFFFEPEIVIRLSEKEMIIEAADAAAVFAAIDAATDIIPVSASVIHVESKLSETEYTGIIEKIRQHILRGDCYELNFCQEFFAKNAKIDAVSVYLQLGKISPNPFSALYRLKDQWLICASPERFLRKQGRSLVSQPIKGTSRRMTGDQDKDAQNRNDLYNSAKDRSENVMVVDLVRNDLAKICEDGSVKVDELYGIYSFPQVHQMISTVSGIAKQDMTFSDIIRATFPMGSMTGAPKKKVMELIEQYERSRRGIFSGAVGYISPEGDFDLNVVIRSIMYNAHTQYLSFQAGSGITFYSDPEKEWEECMMKADAMKQVLENMQI